VVSEEMIMNTKTFLMRTLAVVVVSVTALVGAASSQAAVESNVAAPYEGEVFVPCADGGASESIAFAGALHVLSTVTEDAAGGVHLVLQTQPMGIKGVGQTTGDLYQSTGVTRANLNASYAAELTLINNFRIVGQGRDNNFLVHETLHITVNANGMVTAAGDHFDIDCK
jgi:hypothetical protein